MVTHSFQNVSKNWQVSKHYPNTKKQNKAKASSEVTYDLIFKINDLNYLY